MSDMLTASGPDPDCSPNESLDVMVKSARILMVDDEPINMEVLQIHLEAEGYSNFISISDSSQAIQRIRDADPEVVLLDLMMPVVSGFDILVELRADELFQHLPVLVLTSSNDSETKLKALRLGASDFLSKPVDASELALRLRNTLAAKAFQRRLTHFDQLTGLPNRTFLSSTLNVAVQRLSQKNGMAALLLVNLDRFKGINDSLGREVGDDVLHAFSRRLQMMFGIDSQLAADSNDILRNTVCRIGGDKFVVLLPFLRDPQDAVVLAGPFLKKMDEPFEVQGQEIYLTCSIGISVFPSDGACQDLLLSHAETAMVHAKQRRHNSYAFYAQDMDAKARELLGIENGMRTAVENNEFFLVYQPKVSVVSGRIVGAEALIRWQHPEYGLVSPAHFIPLAEDSGLIVPIGEWVLNEACRQTMEWRRLGNDDFKVAVNVSIRQLHEENFIETIKRALLRSSLPPDALKIELTENMIMENAESNVTKLLDLKAIGVSLSIDDFGTGYSSLSYLQKFPIDELKIDQSFILSISSPLQKLPIVKAVVSLAHDLGMTVVAEGVETHHQLAHIKALKCEEYQGFLCSSPVNAAGFTQLLLNDKIKKAG